MSDGALPNINPISFGSYEHDCLKKLTTTDIYCWLKKFESACKSAEIASITSNLVQPCFSLGLKQPE